MVLLITIFIVIAIMLVFIIFYINWKEEIKILKVKIYLFHLPQEVVNNLLVNIPKIKNCSDYNNTLI